MIKIGICDDVCSHREMIKKLCDRFFQEKNLCYECVIFTSGEDVIQYSEGKLLLLFLDIEMSGMDGIQVKKILEEKDHVWRIVFISNHDEVVYEAFGIKTLGFGKKPVGYEKIKHWLTIVLKENIENRVIAFQTTEGERRELIENLVYLKAAGHYVYVNTLNGCFLADGQLKIWQQDLANTPIFRIHKSYMVNLQYVDGIADTVNLRNMNEHIPVGRSYKAEVKNSYQKFLIDRMNERMHP